MLRKMILVAVVGGLAVAGFKGTKWASYARSEWQSIKEAAEDSIPPEREIERLRSELQMLDTDVMKVVHQLAKERVGVERLNEQVADVRGKQSQAKELLTARAKAIKDAEAKVAAGESGVVVLFGDRKATLPAARAELEEGVKRYTANQKSLDTMQATLASRERVRDGLEKQLEALKNQKGELATAIDALEAELTVLKLQQTESKYQTDNTRLAKIKEDMRGLKMKVDVEREKLKLMPAAFDEPAATTPARSVDDIMAPLTGSKPAPKVPAATD